MVFLLIFFLSLQDLERLDPPFCGKYLYEIREGIYLCASCRSPLFSSSDKYESGSGFPSFTQPISKASVYYLEDWELKFKRYKVLCRSCHAPLGHLFHDGPLPKELRYCIHSSTLIFNQKS